MLDKPTLINDLEALFNNEATQETDAAASRTRIATAMANAIEKYVKTGLVKVTTSGTATAQTGTGNIT